MSKSSHDIKDLYEKYRSFSASELEIDAFFDYLKNPENLEILKNEMGLEWSVEPGQTGISPLTWDAIEVEIRKQKARERKLAMERRNKRYWWAAAASLLVVIGLSIGIYLTSGPGKYVVYTTGYGEVEKIVLEDGSQITLNANSELRWKRDWQSAGHRLAILNGEAFFNVETIRDASSNEKTGFDVQTGDLTIQVVGTSFNVKSRTEKTDIFLKEGKILLDLHEENVKHQTEEEVKLVVMQPGESVSYSSKTQNLEKAVGDQYGNASWMVGTFMYSNKSVREILQSLEEIYGVDFEVEDQNILDRKLTTNLPYSDWAIVESGLELLLQSRLERKDGKIVIKKRE